VEIPDRTTAEIVLPERLTSERIRVEGDRAAVEATAEGRYRVTRGGRYVFRAY
jgi:hypothetical protein